MASVNIPSIRSPLPYKGGITFKPGTPSKDNHVETWAEVFAICIAHPGTTITLDGSLGQCQVPTGVYDWQGGVIRIESGGGDLYGIEGAQFVNWGGIELGLGCQLRSESTTVPFLVGNSGFSLVFIGKGGGLVLGGAATQPILSAASGFTLVANLLNGALDNSQAPGVPVCRVEDNAGLEIATLQCFVSSPMPADLVSGSANGTTLILVSDDQSPAPTPQINYLGVPQIQRVSDLSRALWPTSDTAGRPASPTVGQLNYNTDSSAWEGWNGSAWVAIGGGGTGGVITVADAAALAALDTTGLSDGTLVFVRTFRDYFELNTGDTTSTTDGVTVIANAAPGSLRWFRCEIPWIGWAKQAAWTINESSGSDEAPVILKSFEEWKRRTRGQKIKQNTTITATSNLTNVDVTGVELGSFVYVRIFAAASSVAGSGTITSYNAPNVPVNTLSGLGDTGATVANWKKKRIRLTSGANAGAMAWGTNDLQLTDLMITDFCQSDFASLFSTPSTARPSVGNTYDVQNLYTLNLTGTSYIAPLGSGIAIDGFDIINTPFSVATIQQPSTIVNFFNCRFSCDLYIYGGVQFANCLVKNITQFAGSFCEHYAGGNLGTANGVLLRGSSEAVFWLHHLFATTKGLIVSAGATATIKDVGFYNTSSLPSFGSPGGHINVLFGGTCRIQGAFYGNTATRCGANVVGNGSIRCDSTSSPTAVGTIGETEQNGSLLARGFDEGTGLPGPQYTATWANILAAAGKAAIDNVNGSRINRS